MSDIFQRRAAAKAAVNEIQQRKQAHLRTIEAKENELANFRSQTSEEARAAAASAFFQNEPAAYASTASLESEIIKLYDQLPFYDIEIKSRQKALNALAGEYQAAVWAPLKKLDDANKTEMAELLIRLAKCCALEIEHVDETQRAETDPPASFRLMRPNFIGQLNDPNSFVNLWLRELATYYPHVAKNLSVTAK